MLGNVLPGLRELRAPLAAGYLWLVFAWIVWGDELPSKSEEEEDFKRTPLDRFFELEPIVSSIGLAVVASVAAYVLGSIVIDVQTVIGRRIPNLISWVLMRLYAVAPDRFPRGAPAESARREGPLSLTEAGTSMLEGWESARADELREEFGDHRRAAKEDSAAAQWDQNAAQHDLVAAREKLKAAREAERRGEPRPGGAPEPPH
jgi:hypothetical protein